MKKILLLLLISTNIFLTACWDMIEINERRFPYSVGMDLNNNDGGRFIITFSAPNINAIGKNGTQEERVRISSVDADSVFAAAKVASKKVQNPIYTKHVKVLILSEDVGKNNEDMMGILDGFNRDFQINKSVKMALVQGSVEKFINNVPTAKTQEEVEGTLYKLLVNRQQSSAFTPKTVMEFIYDHDVKNCSIIPLGRFEKEEYIFEGGGVFKAYGLIGYIDSETNKGLGFLLNTIREDEINVIYEGTNLSIHIININLKRKLRDKAKLGVEYYMEVECDIQEYTIDGNKDIDEEEILKAIEEKINKEVENIANNSIEKLQKDLGVDYIGVGEYLRKFHPKTWKEVEDDWDVLFPSIDIGVKVNSNIRRRGLTK